MGTVDIAALGAFAKPEGAPGRALLDAGPARRVRPKAGTGGGTERGGGSAGCPGTRVAGLGDCGRDGAAGRMTVTAPMDCS